jgi:hypothetical protein
MIIRPNPGSRWFWGAAGVTLLITGCSMSVLAFPVGLLLLCIALPLAVFSFGFSFGAVQTLVDQEGIFQRNFFFMTKKFRWNEIESGKVAQSSYNRTDSLGWTSRGTITYLSFSSGGKHLRINSGESGPQNWWNEVRRIAEEKLGDRFEM